MLKIKGHKYTTEYMKLYYTIITYILYNAISCNLLVLLIIIWLESYQL